MRSPSRPRKAATGPKRDETVLVVDDSAATVEVLRRNLELHGYHVLTAGGCDEAVAVLRASHVDLVVTDLRMPGASGLDLVRHVKENHRDIEVLMITGYPSVESAVSAVRHGAVHYLPKPFTDRELLDAIEDAGSRARARRALRDEPRSGSPFPWLMGRSEGMGVVYGLIEKAAASSASVLLRGEPGSGKELIARAIHHSGGARGPFVVVHCGSVPPDTLTHDVFGPDSGHGKPGGLMRAAAEGTLYLDDFTSASLADQERLSRHLDDRQRIAEEAGASSVRLVAATDRDLDALVAAGVVRAPLVYQLGEIEIVVPPLRDRGDDIFILARHFAERFSAELGRTMPTFTERALEALRAHRWQGNVRELATTLKRLVATSDDATIDVPDLPSLLRFQADRKSEATRSLEDVEAEHIKRVLAACDGNQSRAAEILGIDRKTLRTKLRRIEER